MIRVSKKITAGRIACLGVVVAIVGNEISNHAFREILEVVAALLAVAGLMLE